jgi:RimJ/RimL family protein N-acetyltransferase
VKSAQRKEPTVKYLMPETIETDRLFLRMFRDEDWRDLYHYYSDEVCMRYTIARTLTEGECWRTMAGMIGHWVMRGYGPYAVEEKSTHAVLGTVGLWFPNDWPEPEVKWGLARQYWGRGYARHAASAVLHQAACCLPELQLISLIHPDNQRSINLALALGAKLEKKIDFRESIWQIYRHQKPRIPEQTVDSLP